MYNTLSDIQKKNFLGLAGEEYKGEKHKGTFKTSKPYNDNTYKLSPWLFSFIFDVEKGYLICELSHRMTNNRTYGWDHEGNELSSKIVSKYFASDMDGIRVVKRK